MADAAMRPLLTDPRFAVYCRCGAAWFGRHSVRNPVIAVHRDRCGDPITRAEFEAAGYRIRDPTTGHGSGRTAYGGCAC